MYISRNVKYLRKKHEMTLGDLAKIMGYKSPTTVNKWEVGENTPPPKAYVSSHCLSSSRHWMQLLLGGDILATKKGLSPSFIKSYATSLNRLC